MVVNEADDGSINFVVGGDFFPGSIDGEFKITSAGQIWGDSLDLFKNADLSIINLEAPLTDTDDPILKTGPNIKLAPKCIDFLTFAGIKVATLANNHIRDFGDQGVIDTISVCKDKSVDIVGAGRSLDEATRPLYKVVKGKTIAIVNFAENEWSNATDDSAGANPLDIIDNARQIKDAKTNADIVLVIVHGGHEHCHYPSPRMVKQYRFYAEQGASVVIGHHTHCISGYEIHNEVPIFYSLGNLFFPSKKTFTGWNDGMLLKLSFNDELDCRWGLIPYQQCKGNDSISLLNDMQKDDFIKQLECINNVIVDSVQLRKKWEEYVLDNKHNILSFIVTPSSILGRIIRKFNVKLPKIFTRHFSLMLNLFRCEAHRDLAIGALGNFLKCSKK